jgi:hypothetical protein
MTSLDATLRRLNACIEAIRWAESQPDAETAWRRCPRGDWLLWVAARLDIDRKLLVRAACACARTALSHVPAGEERPRIAIETAEAWARGEATLDDVRRAARYASNAAAAAYAATAAADAAHAATADDAAHAADAAADAAAAYAAAAAAAYADAAAHAAAYADDDAHAAAHAAATAAADARAAAYAARRAASLARSADIVREIIPWEAMAAKLEDK